MSYILDALKRAESERSRGVVPNIHAPPGLDGESDARGTVASRLGWGLLAVSVVALSAGAWWWFSGDEAGRWKPADAVEVAPEPALSAPTAAAAVAPTVPPSALERVAGSASVSESPPVAPLPAAPRDVPVPARPEPAATARVSPAGPQVRKPPLAAATPTVSTAPERPRTSASSASASVVAGAVAAPASAPMAVAAPAAEERVYALKELPDEVRNSLPVLAVGGATYSENPANRMLIVNGGIFHEGDKLTSEVTLQQIKLRTAVLSYRGYRYAIHY
jgi:general secretion pathway protein B